MSRGELKSMLVRHLIDNHLVSEGDIIKHSYSNQRMMAPRIENQSNPDIFPTLTTRADCFGIVVKDRGRLRIRKITPKECFRLMGFDDSDYEAASGCCTSMELYKQCGNSVAVNCLEAVLSNLPEISVKTSYADCNETRLFDCE